MTRNVVVCCLDTVRQDYFARFAPRLRERADVTAPGCRAASGWSVPSHASMVTGDLPHEHGVHTYEPGLDALDVADTVFGDLSEHASIGVSANVYAGSAFGFDALFDRFVDVSRDHRFDRGLDVSSFVDDHPEPGVGRYLDVARAALAHDRPGRSLANAACLAAGQAIETGPLDGLPTPFDDGAATISRAFTRLVDDTSEPFVGFCNFMEAHEPHRDTLGYDSQLYDVPRGWRSSVDPQAVATAGRADDGDGDGGDGREGDGDRSGDEALETALERYRSTYGASIEYLDRKLVDFVDAVQAATDRETTVVVTADHGENLGTPADEGALGHVTSLSEGVLNVPFLVIDPPGSYPSTVTDPVSHCDLRRLVRAFAREKSPSISSAEPVVAEVAGPTPGNETLVEAEPDRWDRALRAAYDGERKVVWDDDGDATGYEISSDRPCWQRRVPGDAERPPAAACRFEVPLDEFRDRATADADETDLDAGVEERLRDLGYR
ncbi:sulfatase-like hydrolase/transferase [Halospeciosus flavus]|uniref:Sulfatase-like hydrolase/transferase n=1 Tax=Halospeciosus flavus TaxID=3032283 RepID=A0ABD5Z0Y7_9EURY|nr:sulfatase-like hydrolase/transferase [Halospeciosus flavus]